MASRESSCLAHILPLDRSLLPVAANFAFTILSECTGAAGYVPPADAETECATALLNLAIRTTRGSRESEEGKDRGEGTGEVNSLQHQSK